jgi:hypothetical protein
MRGYVTKIADTALILAVILAFTFTGYAVWRHFHDSPVVKAALVDQKTLTAQQELKRTQAFLKLEQRRRARAEAAASRASFVADSIRAEADSARARRASYIVRVPAPVQPDSAVTYWKNLYDDAEVENSSLRAAFDEQKRTAALYQGLYVSTMRSLTDLGNASAMTSSALLSEHNLRQCKIAGLIRCPSRGASYVAGIVTVVAARLILKG